MTPLDQRMGGPSAHCCLDTARQPPLGAANGGDQATQGGHGRMKHFPEPVGRALPACPHPPVQFLEAGDRADPAEVTFPYLE